jgi:hypothetical protein
MTATIAKSESGAAGSASAALLRRLLPLAVVFLATQFLVRLTLTVRAGSDYADDTLGFALPFLVGTWFDLVVFTVCAVRGLVARRAALAHRRAH